MQSLKRRTITPVCAYCGGGFDADHPRDSDHIPSKNLVLEHHRHNIQWVKISSHKKCNNEFSSDEEFLRDRLALIAYDLSASATALVITKITRSMELTPWHAEALTNQFAVFNVFDSHEKQVGQVGGMIFTESDQRRIFHVLDKYIKGLFFHHFGQIISQEHTLKHFLMEPPPKERIIRAKKSLQLQRQWFDLVPGVFSYGYWRSSEKFRSIWITEFFEKTFLGSFIDAFRP